MEKPDVAYFCPVCGGASIDTNELSQRASCRVCHWEGPGKDLLVHRFKHGFGSDTAALQEFINDMRRIFASEARAIAEFLLKWGFVTPDSKGLITSALVLPYIAAMARGAVKEVLNERDKQEGSKAPKVNN